MACHHQFLTVFLVLFTGQLSEGRSLITRVRKCKNTVWGPSLLQSDGNSFSQLRQVLYGFPSERECMAAMCTRQCTGKSNPTQPVRQAIPIENNPTTSSVSAEIRPSNDVIVGSPKNVLTGSVKEIKELRDVLGPQSKLITDKDGQVIGVEAPNDVIDRTSSKPSPQTDSTGPGASDFSICCSTREVFFFNQTLVDYFGRPQVIAQINEMGVYQLIRHGFCGTTGACTGQCDQIYVTLPLVVHPTQAGQQVSFSLFKIPGYCTCRVSALSGLRSMQLQG